MIQTEYFSHKNKLIKKALIKGIPVYGGYLVLSIGFGLILHDAGYSAFHAILMSILIYAGSMQYVAVSLIAADVSLATIALTTFMVNARHIFYGISMIERYRGAGFKKLYMIFGLTDETYSLVCTDYDDMTKEEYHSYCFYQTLFNQFSWVLGTVVGAALANVINVNTAGIDFALTALFLTVFTDQWLENDNHYPAVTGVAVSVICILIFGKSSFLIPAMIGIATMLTIGTRLTGKREEHNEQ